MSDRVVDPVCGMTVDPDRAAGRVDHNGTTYFFCSKGCVAKFTADPERYLSGHREPMRRAAVLTITVVPAPAPSPCPWPLARVPALEPLPLSPQPLAPDTRYTCPMHPEVISDRPAPCPKCGMALEPMVAAP